jgi:hypothetical protein
VRPFPDVATGRWQVSVDGGVGPVWSRHAPDLFYVRPSGDGNRVIAARVASGSTFRVIDRQTLFTIGPE